MFKTPNKHRLKNHPTLGSDDSYGNNGFFVIPHYRIKDYEVRVMASDGEDWEHASVTVAALGKNASRCPTWEEMCWVKKLFWGEDDCVIQYHPQKSEYVNCHPHCLHLWRPIGVEIPIPPKEFVGI